MKANIFSEMVLVFLPFGILFECPDKFVYLFSLFIGSNIIEELNFYEGCFCCFMKGKNSPILLTVST